MIRLLSLLGLGLIIFTSTQSAAYPGYSGYEYPGEGPYVWGYIENIGYRKFTQLGAFYQLYYNFDRYHGGHDRRYDRDYRRKSRRYYR